MRFSLQNVPESFLETAPWIFKSELELDISMDQCWKILQDDHAWKDWHPEVQDIVWDSDLRAVGTSRTVNFSGEWK
jgi:hypothetical protein